MLLKYLHCFLLQLVHLINIPPSLLECNIVRVFVKGLSDEFLAKVKVTIKEVQLASPVEVVSCLYELILHLRSEFNSLSQLV